MQIPDKEFQELFLKNLEKELDKYLEKKYE